MQYDSTVFFDCLQEFCKSHMSLFVCPCISNTKWFSHYRYWPYLEKMAEKLPELQPLTMMKPFLSVMHAKAHTGKCEVQCCFHYNTTSEHLYFQYLLMAPNSVEDTQTNQYVFNDKLLDLMFWIRLGGAVEARMVQEILLVKRWNRSIAFFQGLLLLQSTWPSQVGWKN